MEKLELTVNKKIEIRWGDQVFRSNIQDVNENFFSISIPTKDGEYIPLQKGQDVEMLYYAEANVFQFYTVVIGRKIDGIPLILLLMPKEYTVIQRRRYYRVRKVEYVNFTNYKKETNINNSQTEDLKSFILDKNILKKAVLLDLSGGGMKLIINENVQVGDILVVCLETKNEELALKGQIVRVEQDVDKRLICGISFVELANRDQEKIIQHTFEIMRSQRRKGFKEG